MKTTKLMLAAALALAAGAAHADDFQPKAKGAIMLNIRVSDLDPVADNAITNASGAATGLKAKVGGYVVPTLGLSYFFTDNIAAEVIAGVSQHTVKATGPGTDLTVHKTWLLPPILALQYHALPKERFSPYVGAGAGYMAFFGGRDENGFRTSLKSGFAPAVQAGLDVGLAGRWSGNLDVKKVFFTTDANVNDGALKSKVRLDPWVFSAGVGYKF